MNRSPSTTSYASSIGGSEFRHGGKAGLASSTMESESSWSVDVLPTTSSLVSATRVKRIRDNPPKELSLEVVERERLSRAKKTTNILKDALHKFRSTLEVEKDKEPWENEQEHFDDEEDEQFIECVLDSKLHDEESKDTSASGSSLAAAVAAKNDEKSLTSDISAGQKMLNLISPPFSLRAPDPGTGNTSFMSISTSSISQSSSSWTEYTPVNSSKGETTYLPSFLLGLSPTASTLSHSISQKDTDSTVSELNEETHITLQDFVHPSTEQPQHETRHDLVGPFTDDHEKKPVLIEPKKNDTMSILGVFFQEGESPDLSKNQSVEGPVSKLHQDQPMTNGKVSSLVMLFENQRQQKKTTVASSSDVMESKESSVEQPRKERLESDLLDSFSKAISAFSLQTENIKANFLHKSTSDSTSSLSGNCEGAKKIPSVLNNETMGATRTGEKEAEEKNSQNFEDAKTNAPEKSTSDEFLLVGTGEGTKQNASIVVNKAMGAGGTNEKEVNDESQKPNLPSNDNVAQEGLHSAPATRKAKTKRGKKDHQARKSFVKAISKFSSHKEKTQPTIKVSGQSCPAETERSHEKLTPHNETPSFHGKGGSTNTEHPVKGTVAARKLDIEAVTEGPQTSTHYKATQKTPKAVSSKLVTAKRSGKTKEAAKDHKSRDSFMQAISKFDCPSESDSGGAEKALEEKMSDSKALTLHEASMQTNKTLPAEAEISTKTVTEPKNAINLAEGTSTGHPSADKSTSMVGSEIEEMKNITSFDAASLHEQASGLFYGAYEMSNSVAKALSSLSTTLTSESSKPDHYEETDNDQDKALNEEGIPPSKSDVKEEHQELPLPKTEKDATICPPALSKQKNPSEKAKKNRNMFWRSKWNKNTTKESTYTDTVVATDPGCTLEAVEVVGNNGKAKPYLQLTIPGEKEPGLAPKELTEANFSRSLPEIQTIKEQDEGEEPPPLESPTVVKKDVAKTQQEAEPSLESSKDMKMDEHAPHAADKEPPIESPKLVNKMESRSPMVAKMKGDEQNFDKQVVADNKDFEQPVAKIMKKRGIAEKFATVQRRSVRSGFVNSEKADAVRQHEIIDDLEKSEKVHSAAWRSLSYSRGKPRKASAAQQRSELLKSKILSAAERRSSFSSAHVKSEKRNVAFAANTRAAPKRPPSFKRSPSKGRKVKNNVPAVLPKTNKHASVKRQFPPHLTVSDENSSISSKSEHTGFLSITSLTESMAGILHPPNPAGADFLATQTDSASSGTSMSNPMDPTRFMGAFSYEESSMR